MGAARTDMHRLQEVIRLHRLGQSSRRIARQMQMGRDTIRSYLALLSKAALLDGPVDALPGLDVLRALVLEHMSESNEPETAPSSTVDSWKDEIAKLRAKGAGPTAIHDHLRVNEPDYTGSLSAVMRDAVTLSALLMPAEHGTDEDEAHGGAQLAVVGEQEADAERKREHPLAHGDVGQIREPCRDFM